MINSVVVVGRVVERPEKMRNDKGVIFTCLTLAVQRPFKNIEGNYETDFIKCLIWEGIVDACCEFCTKGSIVGVRGRLQTKTSEILLGSESKNIRGLDVIAEKLSFIRILKEGDNFKEEKVIDVTEN